MKGCFEEQGDELKRVDVSLWAQTVDLLMVPNRWVSADHFDLILGWIDDTCLENRCQNLNIDLIAV